MLIDFIRNHITYYFYIISNTIYLFIQIKIVTYLFGYYITC